VGLTGSGRVGFLESKFKEALQGQAEAICVGTIKLMTPQVFYCVMEKASREFLPSL
jgi:hypothetical protein